MSRFQLQPCGNFRVSYEEELTIFETDFGRLCLLVGLVLLFGVIPFVSSSYLLSIWNTMGIYGLAALGLNILTGYTGLISLGHGAFFGVGTYTAAILTTRTGIPFWGALPVAGLVTAAVGMVFGLPSIRLRQFYLCIATLAGQIIIGYVLVQWEGLTGGAEGIVISEAGPFGIDPGDDRTFYFLIFACLALMTWLAVNLMRTRFGRAFMAIRDNDRVAEGMGIPISRYKLLAFATSSFYAGFAGGLYAYYMTSITPKVFAFSQGLSIDFIAMIIIGGLGSIPGSFFGAIFYVILNELLSHGSEFLMNVGSSAGLALTVAPLRQFVFGLAIVLFIIFKPKGLAEVWHVVRSGFRLWPFSH